MHPLAGELLTIPEFFRHHDRESRPKLSNSATVMATEVTALSRREAANRQSTAFTSRELSTWQKLCCGRTRDERLRLTPWR